MSGEEKNLENRAKNYIELMGGWQVKYFANGFTKSGVPDILVCLNGRFIAVEVKSSSGRPSPLQIHQLRQIHESGGYSILLYPDNYEIFKVFINDIKNNDFKSAKTKYEILKCRWTKYEKQLQQD